MIESLNKKKSAISSCIRVKHLTESVDIYLPFLTDIISQSPDELKLAEVIPLIKKAYAFDKVNYRDLLVYSRTCLKFLKE